MKFYLTLVLCFWFSTQNVFAQEASDAIESAQSAQGELKEGENEAGEAQGLDQENKTKDGDTAEVKEAPQEPEKLVAPLPFILRPYEVKIFLTVSSESTFINNADARIAEELQQRLTALYRQMWNLDVELNNPGYRFALQELELFTNEDLDVEFITDVPKVETIVDGADKQAEIIPDTLNNRLLELAKDKIFFVSIDDVSGEIRVCAREWDASSRTLSSLHKFSTFQRRYLTGIVSQAVIDAFRPIAEVEVIDGEKVEFLIRAGELYPRDLSLVQFKVGDYLTPFMRYMNRKREVQKITTIPWTYLKVEEITRSRMRLKMTSAFRSPIPASRRRVEVMGLAIKPHLAETNVRIYPRGNNLNPLVGVRCEIMDRLPTLENPVEDRKLLTTDRNGTVRVPVNPANPLQFIVVYSGNSTLAQVPFIPGDQPFLEVEVPDDTARLTVEGEVALLQSELLDIIATREVLFSRARAAAKKKDWGKVDEFVKQLEELQTFEKYQARIETLRVQAVYAAQQAKDRVAEIKIKKLCDGVLESSQKHLDPFRIAEFRREMSNQRRDS